MSSSSSSSSLLARAVFFGEAILNASTGAYMLFMPRQTLAQCINNSHTPPSLLAVQLTQFLGAIQLLTSLQLALASGTSVYAVSGRKLLYTSYACADALIAALFGWMIVNDGDGGFDRQWMRSTGLATAGLGLFRVALLVFCPGYFEPRRAATGKKLK